jgi:general stress protein 26
MRSPQTTLDTRFSAPDSVATEWNETVAAIEAAGLFCLSTVRGNGRPHVTPLVAVWLDDALHFCTGTGEQKSLNLDANPHVVLTTGGNDWQRGLDIVVEGDSVRVTDADALKRLADAWTTKWDGRWRYVVDDGYFHHPHDPHPVLVYAVAPSKVFAFAEGQFGQTTHRFET